MKKIVALVLCLVLALALCTVSFAASDLDVKAWTMYNLGTENDVVDDIVEINKDEGKVDEDDGVEPTVYEVVVENADGSETSYFYYASVKAVADAKLVKGSTVVWLEWAGSTEPDVDYVDQVVDKFIEAVEDPKCGEYDEATYADGVYVIDNEAYAVATTGTMVMYKGLVSYVSGDATAVDHDFDGDDEDTKLTYNTDGEPVGFVCGICGKTYKIVDALPDTYLGTVETAAEEGEVLNAFAGDGYMILLDSTVTAGSTTTVESAKTFDAGIALYAGMALASVAGSAVVIGKKKEF